MSRKSTLAAIAVAATVLAACGGDDDSDADANSAPDTALTAESRSSAAPDVTGSSAEDSASPATGSEGVPADVDPEGRFVFTHCCGIPSLDPHNNPTTNIGFMPLYDRLTRIGNYEEPDSTDVEPMLAESWEFSEDSSFLTLSLRDDVTFHDGSSVNAEAVKASLDRAREGVATAPLLAAVESVDVVDDTTVELNLARPDAALPAVLSTAAGAVINPTVLNDASIDLALSPPPEAGSGPYVIDSFVANDEITYERAPGEYWEPEAAMAKQIVYVVQPEATTRLNGLQAGDYDVVSLFSSNIGEGERLVDGGGFVANTVPGGATGVVLFYSASEKFADPRVRQALAMAVDRDGIAEGVLAGTCTAANEFLGVNPEYENPYPYDPDAARALLAEAGASELTLEFQYPAGSTHETVATVLQELWSNLGLTVNITAVPPSDTPAEFTSGRYDGLVTAVGGDVDPGITLDRIGVGGAYEGAIPADAEEFLALDEQQAEELDPDRRAELLTEIDDLIIQNAYVIPTCRANFMWVAQDKVINLDKMPNRATAHAEFRFLGVLQ